MPSHWRWLTVAAIATLCACHEGDKKPEQTPAPASNVKDGTSTGSGQATGSAVAGSGTGSGSAKLAAVKPPSTGSAMIKPKIKPPSRDEARKFLGDALGAGTKKQCDVATRAIVQAAFDFAEIDAPYVKANEPGLLVLARCAEGQRMY